MDLHRCGKVKTDLQIHTTICSVYFFKYNHNDGFRIQGLTHERCRDNFTIVRKKRGILTENYHTKCRLRRILL